VNGTNPYKGLLYYLEESKKLYGTDLSNKGKHIYIIAAQCFGGQFPANLKKISNKSSKFVFIHGFSYGSTYNQFKGEGEVVHACHLELSMFIDTISSREALNNIESKIRTTPTFYKPSDGKKPDT